MTTLFQCLPHVNVLQFLVYRYLKSKAIEGGDQVQQFRKQAAEGVPLCYETAPQLHLGNGTKDLLLAIEAIEALRASPQFQDVDVKFCFFEGEDLQKLRTAGITTGKKLLTCTMSQLRGMGINKREVLRFESILASAGFTLK